MPSAIDPRWLGRRVVLRHPTAEPGHLADALGDLVDLDADHAVVETAAGPREVTRADVVAARLVEPTTPEILALEHTAALGWRAEDTAVSPDGWLLRANGGVTRRANSALALTTPRRPLPEVVADTRAWYAERGLPLRIVSPLPARSLLDGGLEEYAGLVGDVADDTHVFAARLDRLLAAAPPPPADGATTVAADPGDAWFAVHDGGRSASDPVLRALVTRHDRAGFARLVVGDEVVAVGRGVVDAAPAGRDGRPGELWLGITGLDVVPVFRRRGFARAVLRALWEWGVAQGARRSYLQVASGNQPAIRLYLGAGYWHHHDYRYRSDPA